jgi:hypothetical protein
MEASGILKWLTGSQNSLMARRGEAKGSQKIRRNFEQFQPAAPRTVGDRQV